VSLVFIERPPSEAEVFLLRLVLSTYQDYIYQDDMSTPKLSRPDFRDFGRAVASVVGGTALLRSAGASCYVIVPSDADDKEYVLYCHMSGWGFIINGSECPIVTGQGS